MQQLKNHLKFHREERIRKPNTWLFVTTAAKVSFDRTKSNSLFSQWELAQLMAGFGSAHWCNFSCENSMYCMCFL